MELNRYPKVISPSQNLLVVKRIIFLLVFTALGTFLFGQKTSSKYARDVQSIDAIMKAYYEVFSGSSTDPWQFERDKFIHSENAVITRWDENGKTGPHSLEAEYVPVLIAPKENWYEKELKRTVTHYGNIAQVWSAFEVTTEPNGAAIMRGLTSIQLHFENGRWWIDSWTSMQETEEDKFVDAFLKKQ